MISARLQGGLGNQLFQISAAHALALRNSDESGFNINDCYTPLQGHKSIKYRDNILKNVNITHHKPENIYVEPNFGYNKIKYTKDLLLHGYFQSEKYFIDFKNDIVNLFHIPEYDHINKFMSNLPRPITTVHIRRGDYLNNSLFHSVLGLDYYKSAMSRLEGHNFLIISDDKKWVEDNFNGDNIWKSKFDEIEDLVLMTKSDNCIISNSTFSWWGAYLNRTPDKIVISPNSKNWFGPLGPKERDDIIPNDWIQI